MGFGNNVVDGSASFGRVNSYFTLVSCCILGASVISAGLAPFVLGNRGDAAKPARSKIAVAVVACICGILLSGCGLVWFSMVQKHKGLAAFSGAASIASMVSYR